MLWAVSVCLTMTCGEVSREKVVVVCPPAWRSVMDPWIQWRQGQGYEVVVMPSGRTPQDVRRRLLREPGIETTKGILLVGDVEFVPTWLARAKVNVHWGSEADLATDQPYGDISGDGLPEIPVGRFSADTPEELAVMVGKTLAYEQNPDFGIWRRRVHVVAGVGGFGAITDSVLQLATKHFLTQGFPSHYQLSMTQGDWQSPYCPDPRSFRSVVIERLNEGGLFWVYIGHGQRTYLDLMRTPIGAFPILATEDREHIACEQGKPIAVFLSCYAGALDYERDSLAEELQRLPGGPVALLASSRVTMPYGMAVMGHHMLQECFANRRATLGEMMINAKRRMWSLEQQVQEQPAGTASAKLEPLPHGPWTDDESRHMLDTIAQAISPNHARLDEELREHVLLFNLFGDPLLAMHYPEDVVVDAPDEIRGGQFLDIQCVSPVAGTVEVELICRRDRSTIPLKRRAQFRVDAMGEYDAAYRQANHSVWDRGESLNVAAGDPLRVRLRAPDDARGPGHVRVYVQGANGFAMGHSDVYIRPSP